MFSRQVEAIVYLFHAKETTANPNTEKRYHIQHSRVALRICRFGWVYHYFFIAL